MLRAIPLLLSPVPAWQVRGSLLPFILRVVARIQSKLCVLCSVNFSYRRPAVGRPVEHSLRQLQWLRMSGDIAPLSVHGFMAWTTLPFTGLHAANQLSEKKVEGITWKRIHTDNTKAPYSATYSQTSNTTCCRRSGNFCTMVTGCPDVRDTPYMGAVVL